MSGQLNGGNFTGIATRVLRRGELGKDGPRQVGPRWQRPWRGSSNGLASHAMDWAGAL
jgi:hypothetical protein